jgi:hypothetical protein
MSATSGIDSDASTAKTRTLAAIILQLVFFLIGIIAVVAFFAFAAAATNITNITTITTTFSELQLAPNFAFGIVGLVFSFIFLISVLWVALDYFLIYKNLQAPETVPDARTPALLLGILQLIFGGFIPGILLIIAYVKIGDSLRYRGQLS